MERFDVVIAVNVLHATRNVRAAVGHVKRLLEPGGRLILCETTRVQEVTTLTFGFLDGWWRFDDEQERLAGGPLLSAGGWEALLEEAGLQAVARLAHDAVNGYEPPQHVIVAANDAAPSDAARPAAGDVEEAITASLALVLEIEEQSFDRDTPYTDFGVDSILAVEIVDRINERLGIALRPTDLFNYPSIGKLAAHIAAAHAPRRPAEPAADVEVLAVLQRLAAGEIDAADADGLVARLVERT
jgi:acyl carrier protein